MNSSELSIDCLINSHRYLRTQEKLKMSELKKYCEEGREKAFQQTLDSSWIEVSKLKKMTLMEIVDFIYDNLE